MRHVRVAALAFALLLTADAALARERAGPNTHVGAAAAGLLQGVAVRDQVAVVYAREEGRLRATAVRRVGG